MPKHLILQLVPSPQSSEGNLVFFFESNDEFFIELNLDILKELLVEENTEIDNFQIETDKPKIFSYQANRT